MNNIILITVLIKAFLSVVLKHFILIINNNNNKNIFSHLLKIIFIYFVFLPSNLFRFIIITMRNDEKKNKNEKFLDILSMKQIKFIMSKKK